MTIPLASDVWRKYEIAGVPSSGPNQPNKTDVIAWGTFLESMLGSGAAGLAYVNLAALNADLTHTANTTAIVYGDATAANNGLYVKSGSSGSGSWSRIGDLPNSIVRLTVTGGTANAIIATAPETPTAPGNKLYLMTPTAPNTAAVTINGVPLKDAFGNDPFAGALQNNSQVLMAWAVDHYQLLISANVDASGILAAALAAESGASGFATAAASSASALGNQVHQYDTRTLAIAATIPVGVQAVKITRYATGYPLSYATYIPGTSAGPMAFAEAGGHFWQLDVSGSVIDALWFGVQISSGSDQSAACQGCVNAAQATGAVALFPPGAIKLTSAIAITGSCHVKGTGFEGDSGLIYGDATHAPAFPTKSTPWTGTTFVCGTTNGAFTMACRQSVIMEDFHVQYPAQPTSGTIAINWDSAAGTSGVNTFSKIRGVIVTGSDIGMTIDNCLNFKHDVIYLDTWTCPLHIGMHGHGNTVNYTGATNCASFGDSDFAGQFFNTVGPHHIIIGTGGGWRFDNIKFNGSTSSAVLVSPQPYADPVTGVQTFNIEPLIFGSGISWEGSPTCLAFQPSSTSHGVCSEVSINGGQMWGLTSCINFVDGTITPKWVNGVAISGVKMLFGSVGGGAETGISFSGGVKNASVTGCNFGSIAAGNAAFSFSTGNYAITNKIRTSGNGDGDNPCLPAEVTPSIQPTNTPVTNNNPFSMYVIVTGGTKTGYVVNGVSIDQTSGGTFVLRPGDTLAIVYNTSSPTWHWYAINP